MRRELLLLSAALFISTASSRTSAAATTTIAAPQISGVGANTTNTTATITWTTDVASDSRVQFSDTTNPPGSRDPSVSSSTLVTSHSIQLTGLLPGTQYFYNVTSCVSSKNCSSNTANGFKTSPVAGTWKDVSSPDVAPTNASINNQLRGIKAISDANVWAVGWANNPQGSFQAAENTLIEHFDGQSWQIVPSPNTRLPQNELHAVSGTSATDVWAVGMAQDPSTGLQHTLTLHFNGSSWSLVPSPSNDTAINFLTSVVALSPTNAYAAGYHAPAPTTANPNPKDETLILHWDGTSWTQIVSPNPNLANGSNNQLFGLTAISATDVWAVGFTGDFNNGFAPLTLHFDGTSWNVIAAVTPSTGVTGDYFAAVSAVASNDVWAVGQSRGSSTRHVIEHWDGSQWTKFFFTFSPFVNTNFDALYAVSAAASNFVWAVGEIAGTPLIVQWNGTAWNEVAAPIVNGSATTGNTLHAVSASGINNAFSAGEFFVFTNLDQTAGKFQTLTETYSVP